jgi:hypothetical protein
MGHIVDRSRQLLDQPGGYPPRRVARICDVPAARIEEAAELLGTFIN